MVGEVEMSRDWFGSVFVVDPTTLKCSQKRSPNRYLRPTSPCIFFYTFYYHSLFYCTCSFISSGLKYSWEIFEYYIAFLDTSVSISGKRVSTSLRYKPTNWHSYLYIILVISPSTHQELYFKFPIP